MVHTCVPMGIRLKTVVRTIIFVNQLSFFGRQILSCYNRETCSDGIIWPIVCSTSLTDDPAQEDLLQNTKNEWTRYQNKIVWLSFVLMQDFWQRLMSDSVSWQKNSDVSWVHFAKRRKFIWTKRLDSSEHKNWARVKSHFHLLPR